MTEEATPEQVVEFMTNTMKSTPKQIVTMLRAEIERLKAGWETAFNIGVSEQEQNKKLRAEVGRLKIENNDRVTRLLTQIIAMRGAIERLTAGLQMLAKQEYDAGYTPEGFAEAILSGDEPALEDKSCEHEWYRPDWMTVAWEKCRGCGVVRRAA